MKNFLTSLKDPSLVCNFQSFFGVKKVTEIENVKEGSWIAEEIEEAACNKNSASYRNDGIVKINDSLNGHIPKGKDSSHNIVYYKVIHHYFLHLIYNALIFR